MAATAVVEVWGGPVEADALSYKPDAFANGRAYEFMGKVSVQDLASFLNSPNSWTPRRFEDNMDLTSMDKVIGTTGAAFGDIWTGGFIGNEADGISGRSVCWAIRKRSGDARGTLLIYTSELETNSEGNPKWGHLREITADAPAPWSALGEVNGAKVADDWTHARVYSGVVAGESVASMFEGGTAAVGIDTTRMDWTNVTDMSRMFAGCAALAAVSDGASAVGAEGRDKTTGEGTEDPAVPIEAGAVFVRGGSVVSAAGICEGDRGLERVSIATPSGDVWPTVPGADVSRAFAGCTSLEDVSISGLNTPSLIATEMLTGAGTDAATGGTVSITNSFAGDA